MKPLHGAAASSRSTAFTNGRSWARSGNPYAVGLAGRRLMALAGLWETWRSPAGERVRSFTIVTTVANPLLAEIHDRMPVILAPEAWPAWLGEQAARPEQLKSLLAPYPAEDMVIWPVPPSLAPGLDAQG